MFLSASVEFFFHKFDHRVAAVFYVWIRAGIGSRWRDACPLPRGCSARGVTRAGTAPHLVPHSIRVPCSWALPAPGTSQRSASNNVTQRGTTVGPRAPRRGAHCPHPRPPSWAQTLGYEPSIASCPLIGVTRRVGCSRAPIPRSFRARGACAARRRFLPPVPSPSPSAGIPRPLYAITSLSALGPSRVGYLCTCERMTRASVRGSSGFLSRVFFLCSMHVRRRVLQPCALE